MTLQEKYSIGYKRRIGKFFALYSILALFFIFFTSTASKYDSAFEGNANAGIAALSIKLNGNTITDARTTITDGIVFIPTSHIDANKPEKIKPGQSGYFDIVIDPTNTEVSFEYKVLLDIPNSTLPNSFTISSYLLNSTSGTPLPLPTNNTITRNCYLDSRSNTAVDSFLSADTQTIRYFWTWGEDSILEDNVTYKVAVTVEFKQII